MAASQEIGIRIGLQGAREVDEGLARIRGGMDRMGSAATTLRNAMGGLAGAFAGVVSVREFVQAADSITELQNRLKLATGGAQQAAQAYSALYDIAQRSRTGFVELGQTFSTITTAASALGVSQDRLLRVTEAIGNAVTISGSSAQAAQAALMQLGQGLASGTLRGEELNSVMEQTPRLAQALADGLGVSRGELRKLGEQGAITADQVIKALESQADMLSGEVKNATLTVGQAMTQLQNSVVRLVGDADKASGATSALASAIGSVASAADTLGGVIRSNEGAFQTLAGVLAGAAVAAGAVAVVKSITAISGAVAALGVVLAANPLIWPLLGIGAAVGGFAAYNAAQDKTEAGIRRTIDALEALNRTGPGIYNRDAESMRKWDASVAERTAKIKDLQSQLALMSSAGLDNRAEDARLQRGIADAARAKKDMDAAASLLQKLDGVPTGYLKDMEELIRLHEAGAISAEAYQKALGTMQAQILKNEKTGKPARADAAAAARLAKEQAQAEEKALQLLLQVRQNAANARNAEANEIDAYMRKQEQAAEQALASVNDRISALRDEEAAVTMAASLNISLAEAVERVALARLQEEQAKYTQGSEGWQAIEREIAARKELLGLISDKDAREHAARAADRAAADWEKTSDQINQSLTDALMRGFESGKDFAKNMRDTVVNMFKTMVLRPVISAIISPVAGAITGALGLSSAAQAGQGISGVSTAISGASLLGRLGAFGGGMSAGFGGLMGSLGLSATGSTLGGAMSAGSIALGSGNILGGLGTFAGALGPIALGIGLLSSAFSRKLKDQGIQGTLGGEAGFEGQQYRFYKGGLFRSDKTTYSAVDPELARVLAGGFSAVQDQVTNFAEALSLPTDRIKGFTTDIKVSFKGLDEAGIQKALQDALATGSNELAQQVLGTLTTTTREVTETLAGGMGDWGDGTMQTVTRTIEETTYAASEYAREGEQAIDTLTRLATSLSGVNTIWDQLGNTVYEASLAGADAASKMADAFGGLEAMAQATGAYFQNFYSAEEQRAAVERQLNEALGKLNLTLPDIDATDARAQYRALAEAQDRNTEAGREAYVVLLQLSGAFASVTAESETAAAAAARLADEQRKSEEAATRAAEEAARRAEEIARERYGLETQLMQLLGDTAGLRKREIEALDASNRALQEHIYAIEDARAAYDKSIASAQSAYSVLESSVGRDRSALQSALDAERDAISARYKLQQDGHAAQISAAQSAADKMRGIASMLSGALGRMVVESPALDRARLQSARGVIGAAAASSNVMAPGLEGALSVVTGDVRKMYGRWEDFAFDQGVTAGQTAALSSAAQSQLAGYESIVNALKAQDDVAKQLADAEIAAAQERFEIESKKLDAQLEQGKSMLDRLLGIEEGTLSSVEALARLTDAVNASNAALRAQKQAEAAAAASSALSASAVQAVGGVPGRSYTDSELASMGFDPADIKAGFAASLSAGGGGSREGLAAYVDRILLQGGDLLASTVGWNPLNNTDASGKKYSDAKEFFSSFSNAQKVAASEAFTNGAENDISDIELRAILGIGASAGSQLYSASGSLDFLDRLARGVNGSHANGLAYVPFDGYRAELHKGERVLTQDEARVYTPPAVVASMLRSGGASDGEILAELRVMRQRLEAIEAAANATAGATVGTKRALDRVVDSDALRTRETP